MIGGRKDSDGVKSFGSGQLICYENSTFEGEGERKVFPGRKSLGFVCIKTCSRGAVEKVVSFFDRGETRIGGDKH